MVYGELTLFLAKNRAITFPLGFAADDDGLLIWARASEARADCLKTETSAVEAEVISVRAVATGGRIPMDAVSTSSMRYLILNGDPASLMNIPSEQSRRVG